MIRKRKVVVSDCHCCKRPGWKREVGFELLTEEEQNQLFSEKPARIKGAPPDAEQCWAGAGSSIGAAIKEGKEIATAMNKRVAFDFNGQLVVVGKYSDVDALYRKWWQDTYHETPEESFKRR